MDEHLAYEYIAQMSKALASPIRLRLLNLLSQGERTVEAIAAVVGESMATISHHLQLLKSARLVTVRRQGRFMVYRLASDEVRDLWGRIKQLAEQRIPELREAKASLRAERLELGMINREELRALLDAGEITLIDVRPREEFDAGHLPGAIPLPLKAISDSLSELPKDRPVVAYCRGPYCRLADQAVEQLNQAGFAAQRFEDGVVEWTADGLDLEMPDESR